MEWSKFSLDADAVRAALEQPKERITTLLAKGATVQQTVWTTTSIAIRVQALTGLDFVATSWADYNVTFLYSVALCAEVDPGALVLTDRQADVAFALAQVWRKLPTTTLSGAERLVPAAGGPGAAALLRGGDAEMPATGEEQVEDQDTDEEEALPWEEAREALPQDLQVVWNRHQAGSLVLNSRELFEQAPR